MIISIYFILFFSLAFVMLNFYLKYSLDKKILDNDDFNYANKITPTGSGIIFCILFFLGSMFFYYFDLSFSKTLPNRPYLLFISLLVFSILSYYDDLKPLDPIFRLVVQFIFVFFSSATISLIELQFPLKLLIFLVMIIWIYIINITNFLDGLDGLLASHTIFLLASVLLIKLTLEVELFSYYIAIILLPVLCAFLIFNKPIAKLYMGDTGSIFLGYLFGFIILELISKQLFFLAISLYIYPILDCGITLVKKMLNGHYPWARLFDYFFLAPVIKGKKSHAYVLKVSLMFGMVNILLIFFQIHFSSFFFILNVIFALMQIYIFNKSSKKIVNKE